MQEDPPDRPMSGQCQRLLHSCSLPTSIYITPLVSLARVNNRTAQNDALLTSIHYMPERCAPFSEQEDGQSNLSWFLCFSVSEERFLRAGLY